MNNLDANGKFISMVRTGMKAPKHIEKKAKSRERNQDRRIRPRLASDFKLDLRLNNLLKRAIVKGMEFDLDEDWLKEKLSKEFCEVTGIRFKGSGLKDPFSRSIDRTDNSIGYIKSNCKVVVWIYNQAKKEYGSDQILEMAKALVRNSRPH